MSLAQLFRRLWQFAKPYRVLLIATLLLTLIGSMTAQVNAFVLKYTIDELSTLTQAGMSVDALKTAGWSLLGVISVILLSKELLSAGVSFGQNTLAKSCVSIFRKTSHRQRLSGSWATA